MSQIFGFFSIFSSGILKIFLHNYYISRFFKIKGKTFFVYLRVK